MRLRWSPSESCAGSVRAMTNPHPSERAVEQLLEAIDAKLDPKSRDSLSLYREQEEAVEAFDRTGEFLAQAMGRMEPLLEELDRAVAAYGRDQTPVRAADLLRAATRMLDEFDESFRSAHNAAWRATDDLLEADERVQLHLERLVRVLRERHDAFRKR